VQTIRLNLNLQTVSCNSKNRLRMTLQPKIIKIMTIIGMIFSILVASYSVGMVWLAISWFQIDLWLLYPTLVFLFITPLLIILTFWKKFIRTVSIIIATLILLSFVYGLHFTGFAEMLRSYTDIVIFQLIGLIILSIVLKLNHTCKNYNS